MNDPTESDHLRSPTDNRSPSTPSSPEPHTGRSPRQPGCSAAPLPLGATRTSSSSPNGTDAAGNASQLPVNDSTKQPALHWTFRFSHLANTQLWVIIV